VDTERGPVACGLSHAWRDGTGSVAQLIVCLTRPRHWHLRRAGNIKRPFLALQAADDPAFSDRVREIVPVRALAENPHTVYVETPTGAWLRLEESVVPCPLAG
jgi:hypothetical protein